MIQPKPHIHMIYVDGSQEGTNLQTVLFGLIDEHLMCSLVLIDRVDFHRGILSVRSGEDDRSTYRCTDNEILHLALLIEVVTGELITPPGQALVDTEPSRVIQYKDEEKRAKMALAVMGRSQMDDDVILKFSLEDLCTAYAIFVETHSRAQKMFVFDGALHLTERQEA